MEALRARWARVQILWESRRDGQGMMEYALILTAVAVVVVIALFAIGPKVAAMFNSAGASLSSDRSKKANFAAVNAREVLARVLTLPIQTWNYLHQGPTVRHVGPLAQDFHAAFGVGEDDTRINPVDANGVALAAIQGLYRVVQEHDVELAMLEARLAALEAREREFVSPL